MRTGSVFGMIDGGRRIVRSMAIHAHGRCWHGMGRLFLYRGGDSGVSSCWCHGDLSLYSCRLVLACLQLCPKIEFVSSVRRLVC